MQPMHEYVKRIYSVLDTTLNTIGRFADEAVYDFSVKLTPRCSVRYERQLFVSDVTPGWFWFLFDYRRARDFLYWENADPRLEKWIYQALHDCGDRDTINDLLKGFEKEMEKVLQSFRRRDRTVRLQSIPSLGDILEEVQRLDVQAQLRDPGFRPWSKPITGTSDLAKLVLHTVRLISRGGPTLVVYHGIGILYVPDTDRFYCGAVASSTHPFYEGRGCHCSTSSYILDPDSPVYDVEFATHRGRMFYKINLYNRHTTGQLLARQGPRFMEDILHRLVFGKVSDYSHGQQYPGVRVPPRCGIIRGDITVLVYD